MSTRSQVEAAIKAIEDKGNNTAKEIRNVLTKLLDYTENQEATTGDQGIEFFDYHTTKAIKDESTGSLLQYSCRGIDKQFANFTFNLEISDNSKNNIFRFPLQKNHANKMLKSMKEILPTDKLSFAVPVSYQSDNAKVKFPLPVIISFDEFRMTTGNSQTKIPIVIFDIELPNQGADNEPSLTSASAYSSVSFHSNDLIKFNQ